MRALVPIGSLCLLVLLFNPTLAHADEPIPAQEPARTPAPPSTPPRAPAEESDTVHLIGGEAVRGRVKDYVPGKGVTVVLPSGESRKIAWDEIDYVSSPNQNPTPPPFVRVRIPASPKTTVLYQRAHDAKEFTKACAAPCGIELPLADTYKIAGDNIEASSEFQLDGSPGHHVELTVDESSQRGTYVGIGLMALGGLLVAGAGVVGVVKAVSTKSDEEGSDSNGGVIGALVGGAVVAGVGFVIYLKSQKTGVTQKTEEPHGGDAATSFRRAPPSWRREAQQQALMPRATFPIMLEHSF